jgi:uncharacterized protein YndB with AHSA1/START domain
MFRHETSLDIARSTNEVFAFLDEVANAPKWLGRCVELKKDSDEANHVGTRLHYAYKDGPRSGTMDGQITDYEANQRLAFAYHDKLLDVAVGFRLSDAGGATHVEHWVEITPKSFMMKLMQPMIRAATKKQMERDTTTLKQLLERQPTATA